MSDTERLWLVFREYTDKGMLSLVYATVDGERKFTKQRAMHAGDPTAALEVETEDLQPVEDPQDRASYTQEAKRMRDRHDPDDQV
jgi:hypothetical protein